MESATFKYRAPAIVLQKRDEAALRKEAYEEGIKDALATLRSAARILRQDPIDPFQKGALYGSQLVRLHMENWAEGKGLTFAGPV